MNKIPFLDAYAITHNYLFEPLLNSSYSYDDPSLKLSGYTSLPADHPLDIKRGGVCIYYKEHFPLICKLNLTTLDECPVCELKVGNKKCFITVLYNSTVNRWRSLKELKMAG